MFDWNRAWYPIAPVDYLNADAPNPVKLLGKRMVLWCSNPETWIAWIDLQWRKILPGNLGHLSGKTERRIRS